MTSKRDYRATISGICLRVGSLALALLVVVVLVPTILATQSAQAQTYKVLYTFSGGADGAMPSAGLIRDADGNLYGTTPYGGDYFGGTIFKVGKDGETVLHSFSGADGAYPLGLLRDAAGNLYGANQSGGTYFNGTVFRLDTTGVFTVLYTFPEQADGAGMWPTSNLISDAAGNLYGTTVGGGDYNCTATPNGCGVVFKLSPAGVMTVLHSFTGGRDGAVPMGGLILDSAGNRLYGTTTQGGAHNLGTVFVLEASGKEAVLYSFKGGADGAVPQGGLIRDSGGNYLYGTTTQGGAYNLGTVFVLEASGKEAVLHSFTGQADGSSPLVGVILDKAGNLYGSTVYGGDLRACPDTAGCGVVFKLDSAGIVTVLHRFHFGKDGGYPVAPVIRDAAGNLYGTTQQGGDYEHIGYVYAGGVVFKIKP
jgi:uncharacterized repeat protein (TIGR03803 family)